MSTFFFFYGICEYFIVYISCTSPSLKLTQKNNTQISNVTTPTTPLRLSLSQNCHPNNSNSKKPRTQMQSKSHKTKHKISLHINPPSNGGAEAKNPNFSLETLWPLVTMPLAHSPTSTSTLWGCSSRRRHCGRIEESWPRIRWGTNHYRRRRSIITTAAGVFHADFNFNLVPLASWSLSAITIPPPIEPKKKKTN